MRAIPEAKWLMLAVAPVAALVFFVGTGPAAGLLSPVFGAGQWWF